MTNSANSAAIVAEINTLRADLITVEAAIRVVGKPAETKARNITAAIEEANERLAAVLADEVVAARAARLAAFSDISVEISFPTNYEGNLLRAGFEISYTKDVWDGRRAIPQRHKCNGFFVLPDDAYEYLVTVKPEAIPAEIMALAPGNPHAAFTAYFQGKRRNMIRTPSRVDHWAGIGLPDPSEAA